MQSAARKLTYDDFLGFPDDGQRHELIDGVHYVTPSPRITHQRLLGRMYAALFAYFQTHPIGEAFVAPLDVVLSMHDVVEPDILVVLRDQQHILTEANVQGAPAIVVEFASPSTRRRDQGIKRDLYRRMNVREYWLVDDRAGTVVVHRSIGDTELQPGDRLTSNLLPGFSMSLNDLFAPAPGLSH